MSTNASPPVRAPAPVMSSSLPDATSRASPPRCVSSSLSPSNTRPKRPRPKMKLAPFDFVPVTNVSSLPPSFYPHVLSARENDAVVGLWKHHTLSACASRRGSRRAQNEDRVFCDHRYRIYGVCDGHGAAALPHAPAEQLAANTVKELLPRMLMNMSVTEAFEQIDRIVLSKFEDSCSIVGTTVAMVRVFDGTRIMQVAHVGDSRVVILRADGSARTLTEDHSPTRADEMARIERDGGYVLHGRVNDILAVSRAIGDSLVKYVVPPTPDVSNYTLRDDDQMVLIGTDGLWDVIELSQVVQICAQMAQRKGAVLVPLDLQRAADAILNKAAEFGRGDDSTVVLLDVRKDARA